MDEIIEHVRQVSRRQLLKSMAAAGVVAAADLAWWEEPLMRPRRARGSSPVRFQFSVPEPKRNALVESRVQRVNQSQDDLEVKGEFVVTISDKAPKATVNDKGQVVTQGE